jgi:hypothetical protein
VNEDPTREVLRLRSQALSWRLVGGEMIALDLVDSRYLTANESGALLWEALAGGTTRAELVAALVGAYDLPHERAEADVDGFLAEAAQRGLLA